MRTLGSYQLLRKIGTGGMAQVWSARRITAVAGEKFVAIKVLASHLAEKDSHREMFISEAKLSLALNHANIVTVFDVVEDAGNCYMVMELIEGMTLAQLLRALRKSNERVPVVVGVHIVAELLRALAYAHELKSERGSTIVHRDVSPQNVMVSTSGEVKLMDFGIARFSTEETNSNMIKGKLQYMPPEQLARQTREPTIDLFAVGGILHELLDGKRFRGNVQHDVLIGMAIRGETPALAVAVPEEIERVRAGLLEPDASRRIQSARQALALLYDWPGYRNASLQLEELVRRYVAPASSTTFDNLPVDPALTPAGSGAGALAPALAEAELVADEFVEEQTDKDAGADAQAADTGGGPARARELEAETDSELPAAVGRRASAKPKLPPAVLIGAAGMALALLLVWLVVMLASGDDEISASGEAPSEQASEQARAEPVPPSEPPSEQPASEPELVLDEQVDTAQADGDAQPDNAHEGTVPVEFFANDFFFLYVKVNGRVLALEPTKKIRLPIGTHTVAFKEKKEDKWVSAGTIKISKGDSYLVYMTKPGGLQLKTK